MSSLLAGNLTPEDRSKRSILVGNISNEATEEELRLLLLEFGPIVGFRFFNKSTGNQIGYAFCEYEMPDMAARAVFKLNDSIFKGQPLKVDTAASEKSREELESFLQGMGNAEVKQEPPSEMDVTTEKAPEEISKAVASLPPEQMFELMKQMKMCIENNPHEARNLLLQNPQLAYALLQAQVIMRIVDPEVAMKILERPVGVSPEVTTSETEPALSSMLAASTAASSMNPFPAAEFSTSGDQDMRQLFAESNMRFMNPSDTDARFQGGMDPRMMQGLPVRQPESRMMPGSDPRGFQGPDPRVFQGPDPRSMQTSDNRALQGPDLRMMQGHPDSRMIQNPDVRPVQSADPRSNQGLDPRMIQGPDSQGMMNPDPRSVPVSDPRSMRGPDPRTSQIPDPRMMPTTAPDHRLMNTIDPRMIPGSKLGGIEGHIGPGEPRSAPVTDPRMGPSLDPRMGPSLDPRMGPSLDPRIASSSIDPRMAASADPRMMQSIDPRMAADPRVLPVGDPRARQISDPRMKQGPDPRIMQGPEMGTMNPVSREDPRKPAISEGVSASTTHLPVGSRTPTVTSTFTPGNTGALDALNQMSSVPQEQEKAALIMQVLQLSDEQIAMLPPEQRQSILILKEQIARSQLST